MNFVKRSLLSVSKNVGRSILIILVLLVIGTMILGSLSIQNAANKSMEFARAKLGGEVTLQPDEMKIITGQIAGSDTDLKKRDADKLINLPNVEKYNYITFGTPEPKDFTPISMFEEDDSENDIVVNAEGNFSYLTFTGSIDSSLLNDFITESKRLIDGRHLNKEDLGKNVVIASDLLVEKNNLKLGDYITVTDPAEKIETKLEIVGIYTVNKTSNESVSFSTLIPYNEFFAPYDTVNVIHGEEPNEIIYSATYYLTDPIHIEQFMKDTKKTTLNFDILNLDARDATYQRMIGPIENVASFTNLMSLLIIISGVIILSLITMISVRERKYEIGVLLSLGERRYKIAGQLLLETLLLAILAFGSSVFLGNLTAEYVGEILLEKELEVTKLEEEKEFMNTWVITADLLEPYKESPIDEINVAISSKEIKHFTMIGILFVVFSTIVPTIFILRLNPRNILLKSA